MHDSADLQAGGEHTAMLLPAECLVLPLLGTVIYPQAVTPLAISQPSAVQLVDEVLADNGLLTFVALRAEQGRPSVVGPDQCYAVGTLAVVHRLLRLPDNTLRIAAEGIARVRITSWRAATPHLRGAITPLADGPDDAEQVRQLVAGALDKMHILARFVPIFSDDLQVALGNEESPAQIASLLAMSVAAHSSVAERQALLEEETLAARLKRLHLLLDSALERIQRRSLDNQEPRRDGVGMLDRRPELLDLPLVQEALALGRFEGMRFILAVLLEARFGDDPQLAAFQGRLGQLCDQNALERLARGVGRGERLAHLASLLHGDGDEA